MAQKARKIVFKPASLLGREAKHRWEAYIEERREFNSRAQLIRHAVEKEIHGELQSSENNDRSIAKSKDDLQRLTNQIDDLRRGMDRPRNERRELRKTSAN